MCDDRRNRCFGCDCNECCEDDLRERCCCDCRDRCDNGGIPIIWVLVILFILFSFCGNNDGRGGLFGGLF